MEIRGEKKFIGQSWDFSGIKEKWESLVVTYLVLINSA